MSAEEKSVVIVGGGITGLRLAYELTMLGVKVTLLEAHDALGAESGLWRPNGWIVGDVGGIASDLSKPSVEQFVGTAKTPGLYYRSDTLHAWIQGHPSHTFETIALRAGPGNPHVHQLTQEEISNQMQGLVKPGVIRAAWLDNRDRGISPTGLLREYERRCEELGVDRVRIVKSAKAVKARTYDQNGKKRWAIETENGRVYHAGAVVNAAGGRANEVAEILGARATGTRDSVGPTLTTPLPHGRSLESPIPMVVFDYQSARKYEKLTGAYFSRTPNGEGLFASDGRDVLRIPGRGAVKPSERRVVISALAEILVDGDQWRADIEEYGLVTPLECGRPLSFGPREIPILDIDRTADALAYVAVGLGHNGFHYHEPVRLLARRVASDLGVAPPSHPAEVLDAYRRHNSEPERFFRQFSFAAAGPTQRFRGEVQYPDGGPSRFGEVYRRGRRAESLTEPLGSPDPRIAPKSVADHEAKIQTKLQLQQVIREVGKLSPELAARRWLYVLNLSASKNLFAPHLEPVLAAAVEDVIRNKDRAEAFVAALGSIHESWGYEQRSYFFEETAGGRRINNYLCVAILGDERDGAQPLVRWLLSRMGPRDAVRAVGATGFTWWAPQEVVALKRIRQQYSDIEDSLKEQIESRLQEQEARVARAEHEAYLESGEEWKQLVTYVSSDPQYVFDQEEATLLASGQFSSTLLLSALTCSREYKVWYSEDSEFMQRVRNVLRVAIEQLPSQTMDLESRRLLGECVKEFLDSAPTDEEWATEIQKLRESRHYLIPNDNSLEPTLRDGRHLTEKRLYDWYTDRRERFLHRRRLTREYEASQRGGASVSISRMTVEPGSGAFLYDDIETLISDLRTYFVRPKFLANLDPDDSFQPFAGNMPTSRAQDPNYDFLAMKHFGRRARRWARKSGAPSKISFYDAASRFGPPYGCLIDGAIIEIEKHATRGFVLRLSEEDCSPSYTRHANNPDLYGTKHPELFSWYTGKPLAQDPADPSFRLTYIPAVTKEAAVRHTQVRTLAGPEEDRHVADTTVIIDVEDIVRNLAAVSDGSVAVTNRLRRALHKLISAPDPSKTVTTKTGKASLRLHTTAADVAGPGAVYAPVVSISAIGDATRVRMPKIIADVTMAEMGLEEIRALCERLAEKSKRHSYGHISPGPDQYARVPDFAPKDLSHSPVAPNPDSSPTPKNVAVGGKPLSQRRGGVKPK